MYKVEHSYLKEKIKEIYESYRWGKVSIIDVARYFNLKLDESRLGDYKIELIDFDGTESKSYEVPCIRILDTKNNTTTTAKYTSVADLLRLSTYEINFLEVVTTGDGYKVTSLYDLYKQYPIFLTIGFDGVYEPIITEATFTKEDYNLSFTRTREHNVNLGFCYESGFKVRYSKNVDGGFFPKNLLMRKFNRNSSYLDIFELDRVSTHEPLNDNAYDRMFYIQNGYMVYYANEIEKKDKCRNFKGLFCESTNIDVEKYLRWLGGIDYFQGVGAKDLNAIAVFEGYTRQDGIKHKIEVSKSPDGIAVIYDCKKYCKSGNEDKEFTSMFVIPNYDHSTNMTIGDIANIIVGIEEKFGSDEFIDVTVEELREIHRKLCIRAGVLPEDLDPLSPKVLIDMPFEDILATVSATKDSYFELAQSQYDSMVKSGTLNNNVGVRIGRLKDKND